MANTRQCGHRPELIQAALDFVRAAMYVPGVRSISFLGSIVTDRRNPKDIDLLLVVSDETDIALLASHARRLQGRTQAFGRGAEVFLADERGKYLGRTCHWKNCRPGVRQACDALHCGRRPHLHDDFRALQLSEHLIEAPPVTIWPRLERRCVLPPDVEGALTQLASPPYRVL